MENMSIPAPGPEIAREPPQPCFLLRLPPELRNAIYELAVRYDDLIDLISLPRPAHCVADCADAAQCIYPALTRVRGQIGSEALSVFFDVNSFIAGVRWIPVAKVHKPGNPSKLPASGIRGLRRSFERIGQRHCKCIRSLELNWKWGLSGEANLKAMAAWAALWAKPTKGMPCVPKVAAITHAYVDERDPFTNPLDPLDLAFPPDLRDTLFTGPKSASGEPLRDTLRRKLAELGTALRKRDATELDGEPMKNHVVAWVMNRSEPKLEKLKDYTRRRWQTTTRYGKFRHSAAHRILDVNRRHLSPLFRLNPELRNSIYALVLPTNRTVSLSAAWGFGTSLILQETDEYLYTSGLRSDPFVSSASEYSFLNTLPPILRLNHELSAEALPLYLHNTVFEVKLEFAALEINKLREFACEVRALKSTTSLELHVQWFWPQSPAVQTLVAYAELFKSDGSSYLEPHLRLIHTPAFTTLTRILAELLGALEHLGRTKGRRFGDSHTERLGDRAPEDVFDFMTLGAWMRDCMLDWIMEDNADEEDCREAKELCRDVFRHDFYARMKSTGQNERVYETVLTGKPAPPLEPPLPPGGEWVTWPAYNDSLLPVALPPSPPPPPPPLPYDYFLYSPPSPDVGHPVLDSTECYTCRARRKTCDGRKPSCANCERGGFSHCRYGLLAPNDIDTPASPSGLASQELSHEHVSAGVNAEDGGNVEVSELPAAETTATDAEVLYENSELISNPGIETPVDEERIDDTNDASNLPPPPTVTIDPITGVPIGVSTAFPIRSDGSGLEGADTRVVLRHPKWLYRGCGYPFEEGKGKMDDGMEES